MKKNYVKSMDGMTVSLNEKQALEKTWIPDCSQSTV